MLKWNIIIIIVLWVPYPGVENNASATFIFTCNHF